MKRVPTVCLALIVRDEADKIEKALAHAGVFDSVLVVDTGSTDATVEIAQRYGKVIHFQWCDDFAKARNVWKENTDCDWIFWLDADDEITLDTACKVLDYARNAGDDVVGGFFKYVYPNDYVVDHIRLYRREVPWRQRIHEYLDFAQCPGIINPTGLSVHHTGYPHLDPAAMERKSQRNLRLLREELKVDPKNALILQYIAIDYLAKGQYKRCVEYLNKALECSRERMDYTWLPEAYVQLARCYTKLGKRNQARKAMEKGLKRFPESFAYAVDKHLATRRNDGTTNFEYGKRRAEQLQHIS